MTSGSLRQITIYTDGGADPNPGLGGWAAILVDQKTGFTRELAGGEPETTNNRMELTAAIQALEAIKQPCEIDFFTDSEYLRRGITEWLDGWIANNWRRTGANVSNIDLWQRLVELVKPHTIHWQWVKGHTGDRFNERADQLASEQIRSKRHSTKLDAAYEVFTCVSCRNNVGGWAALVRKPEGERVISGSRTPATSNQLDIIAATKALRALPQNVSVACWTTSDYLRNGALQWLGTWQMRGWVSKDGKPVANSHEWQQLAAEIAARHVEWPSVKEHPHSEFARLEPTARAEAGQRRLK